MAAVAFCHLLPLSEVSPLSPPTHRTQKISTRDLVPIYHGSSKRSHYLCPCVTLCLPSWIKYFCFKQIRGGLHTLFPSPFYSLWSSERCIYKRDIFFCLFFSKGLGHSRREHVVARLILWWSVILSEACSVF